LTISRGISRNSSSNAILKATRIVFSSTKR
jgi:hypothetical protein